MPVPVKTCVLCGRTSGEFRPYSAQKGWTYVRCPGCQLVFLNPAPTADELRGFYNDGYHYHRGRYQKLVQQQKNWLPLLEEFCKPPGKFLEIGCSYGFFLETARQRGWDVAGIELSDEPAAHAREQLGLPVTAGTLADFADGKAAAYDLIVAWHVLEHEPEPARLLAPAFRLLRSGGILGLRVPNMESAVARLAGPYWQWLSPPEHIYMYSTSTLGALVTQQHFEVLRTGSARGNARNMWFEILRARAKLLLQGAGVHPQGKSQGASYAPPRVYQDSPWYRAAERAAEVLTAPLEWMVSPALARRGQEAEVIVVGRKP